MTRNEMAYKILSVVNAENPGDMIGALTIATAVVAKAVIKEEMVEEFAEVFKRGLIEATKKANVTIAIVKMNDNC